MEFLLNFICDSKEKTEIIARQTILQSTLKQILKYLKRLPRAVIFLKKVGKKEAPGYYDVIKNPMDLGTMAKKLPLYRSLDEFRDDIDLIINNCMIYNAGIEYYIECANDLRAEANALLMKHQKVFAKDPQPFTIEGLEIVDCTPQLRNTILKYLKLVGFEAADKRCLDILCDVLKYRLCNYIKLSTSEEWI
ncbi:uncharacterized protein VICG_00668 [Vittaforma corneae ATCC 50505]|uniref:Bromo domain-containing protein n=1 Tax=Vittaforma corneae (strain ATCC 50505) TaxID=993615 RepID=L2GNS2_VITCO|nr:uncharacterized protein VICG_00668 [Vittaforma corneae ATCC 50505]ELA42269.1 hypothetical protein VICG_00668 [Vittaforma corneae ATCC 50505]